MCEPVTITATTMAMYTAAASAAASVGSALFSHQQQGKLASAQAAGIQEQTNLRLTDQANQQAESLQDGAQQMSDKSLEARRELSLVQTIAGENGAGNTAARLANASKMRGGVDLATINANTERQVGAIGRDTYATIRTGQTSLSQIQRPSWVGTGLQIGGAALDAYGKYDTAKTNADLRRSRGT